MAHSRYNPGGYQNTMDLPMRATLSFPSSKPPFTITEVAEWLCEYRKARYGLATLPYESIIQSSVSSAYLTYSKEEVPLEKQGDGIHVRFAFDQAAAYEDYEWSHVPNLTITNGVYDGSLIHHSPGVVRSYNDVAIPASAPVLPIQKPFIPPQPPRVGPNEFIPHSLQSLALISFVVLLGELWLAFCGGRRQPKRPGQKKTRMESFTSEGRNVSKRIGNSSSPTIRSQTMYTA